MGTDSCFRIRPTGTYKRMGPELSRRIVGDARDGASDASARNERLADRVFVVGRIDNRTYISKAHLFVGSTNQSVKPTRVRRHSILVFDYRVRIIPLVR